MYEYSVYWIIEDVARHYFHKSDILYRFLKDYQDNRDRIDLAAQFAYITKNIPQKNLIPHMKQYYRDKGFIKINRSLIEIYKDGEYISLHMNEKHLKFRCKTLQVAEGILFPMLRQFQPILFITGNDIDKYGWISPVSKLSEYQREQVLYS
ncbi:hypothetical protein CIL03_03535 [Virgibacillus indicus]|uniref:Sporulation inhibitor of replication protein SirA n=1 Tax=Virgibacillus indicus TaxID=2024554 RepID=A0A265NDW8_9BACI|nr:sporulation inhibitor of replication protein SirA [Virgibacillus indicus]OZU90228.1 hypothetical protein CIL03_03535 [Virgibacillus indicus]